MNKDETWYDTPENEELKKNIKNITLIVEEGSNGTLHFHNDIIGFNKMEVLGVLEHFKSTILSGMSTEKDDYFKE